MRILIRNSFPKVVIHSDLGSSLTSIGRNQGPPSVSALNCYVRVALKKGDKEMKVKTTRNLPVADTSVLIKFNQQLQFTVRKDTELVSNTWLLVELFVKSANFKGN